MNSIIEKFIGSEETVVSFSGIGTEQTDSVNEEFYNLTQHNYNVIFVMDHARSWFNDINVNEIISKIKTKKVYAIGNSMGAYNACMFSSIFKVDAVLGFSVQYSVNPHIVPWEHRWDEHTTKITNWKYDHIQFSKNTRYLMINGDQGGDKEHLDLIPNNLNIQKVLRKNDGHLFTYDLKIQNILYPIINDFFRNDRINILSYK